MFDNSKEITLVSRNRPFKKVAGKAKNKQIDDENETKKSSFEQVQISKFSLDFIHSNDEKLKNRLRIARKKNKIFEKIEKEEVFEKNFNNDQIDYIAFFAQQFAINKRLEQKRLFKIVKARTKKFQQFLIRNEIYKIETEIDSFRLVNRRQSRNVTEISQNFNNETFTSKKSKFYQLRLNTITKYFEKNFKKFRK